MARKAPHKIRSMQAFSLIEAAIVLGVIGLVIGGIWVAADTVSQRSKAARTMANILTMSQGLINLYSNLPWPDTMDDDSSVNLNSISINANLFPRDWIINGRIVSPYGNDNAANWKNGIYAGLHGTTERLAIQISGREGGVTSGATYADCNWLVMATGSQLNKIPSFYGFQITTAGTSQWFLKPIDSSAIDCPNTFQAIRWWFNR